MATSPVSGQFDYTSLNARNTVKKTSAEEQQDRFMKLLVKQLQSQDPMNPMDNAQTTSQLAQINTVTGIDKLNQTMSQMTGMYAGTQVMQAAGLIGKEVLSPGNGFRFDGSKPADLRVQLSEGVTNGMVTIRNEKGLEVAKVPVNNTGAGLAKVEWDGKKADGTTAPAGNYSISAVGQKDGKEIALNTTTWQVVKSVEFGSDGVGVYLANGNKTNFGSVIQIQSANG
ncbi:flagellar hook assembly protein FlgD [Chitinibacter bivalviorum]|uniref:Basal-body rod modification protein FlgD n=1 Tax=Chitinibacter bivalviorum TaxID=2739434 RepID=A0A7H9BIR9_9NEIS|nr:flagellar hook assembly protein FlgD [Chitinibacter bivalviorum]QLG88138.1 flagellar hook assembly protein FlgD [Chitinibacter bivalviorum]